MHNLNLSDRFLMRPLETIRQRQLIFTLTRIQAPAWLRTRVTQASFLFTAAIRIPETQASIKDFGAASRMPLEFSRNSGPWLRMPL